MFFKSSRSCCGLLLLQRTQSAQFKSHATHDSMFDFRNAHVCLRNESPMGETWSVNFCQCFTTAATWWCSVTGALQYLSWELSAHSAVLHQAKGRRLATHRNTAVFLSWLIALRCTFHLQNIMKNTSVQLSHTGLRLLMELRMGSEISPLVGEYYYLDEQRLLYWMTHFPQKTNVTRMCSWLLYC